MDLPTLSELINDRSWDLFSGKSYQVIGLPGIALTFEKSGILVIEAAMDGSIQKFGPTSLRVQLFQQPYHSILAGHAGGRKMYGSLRQDY